MANTPYENMLEELKNAGKLKNNWYLVASITEKVKEASDGPNLPAKRLKAVANSCGYSPNTINRMLALKRFFDSVRNQTPELGSIDPNCISFPSLELVMRLQQVDPEEGSRMFRMVVAGEVTFRNLREHYKNVISMNTHVASAHQIARVEGREFEKAAIDAVKVSADDLFGEEFELEIAHQKYLPLSVDVIAYKKGTKNRVLPPIGLEIAFIRATENTKHLDALLHRSVFTSFFYQQYWVIFASSMGKERIKGFCKIFDELNITSIGVTVLPWGEETKSTSDANQLQIVRKPGSRPHEWGMKLESIIDIRLCMNNLSHTRQE